jgi:hypothetical protein
MIYDFKFPDSFDEYLRGSFERWIEEGIDPGNFLTAVLRNDLSETIGRADEHSIRILPDIVRWIYSNAPSACWGSPEKVKTWKGHKYEATATKES